MFLDDKGHHSTPASVFDRLYQKNADPWNYTTSRYEQTKYRISLAALFKERYASALEIGCSIGVMTNMLASRCDALLAVDHSQVALEHARERCKRHEHVAFACLSIPREFPTNMYDLIVLSEVGYYWSREDLALAHTAITGHLSPQGHLLLVHWLVHWEGTRPVHPLTADEVHGKFFQACDPPLTPVLHLRAEMDGNRYRLDLFVRQEARAFPNSTV